MPQVLCVHCHSEMTVTVLTGDQVGRVAVQHPKTFKLRDRVVVPLSCPNSGKVLETELSNVTTTAEI